ncbi:PAS domain-containing protein [Agrobacterium larrymoorei]|uniref:PAS domain-containing protein n=1 Tax=Agrobacterium larrymoorei TaxID=160699 RepID=UPI00157389AE|nr:PAS domain-containing protein [Agrobacterium larrymoorei]NTJ42677.1 PAS domain-containing protein [Agrobacterium larrymoorei]
MPDTTSHQRYVAISFGGFYTWDVTQNTFWADDKFAQITGIPLGELDAGIPAERMMAIIHPDDLPFVVEGIKNSVLSGDSFEMVYRVLRDNVYVKIVEYGKCFRHTDGVATLFTGIVFDTCPYSEQASNVNAPLGVNPVK